MVTSNKGPEKKIAKMAEQNSSVVVVPQRTLLGEVNEHITCPLCHGYYIDATTIVECLHSFCRSCIIKHLQVKSYCPVCEMMINSAKPNIKLDKALQDIVYKLVPGLFQKEMERRQLFYSSRPGPAASATPEQRGEDTERIIFSPEDVISFSLEYCDVTDTDSVSSKSSDSNEAQSAVATARRYLQCPAVVNISHLKKFLSMKFDIDSTQFAIDILYKRVPLPDYYTLMDIAYIYNWKRNEPMRFFYQIIDYVAIRSRIFDINRKGTHFRDRKSSPSSTEDTNVNSPAPNLNDQGSEASSGIDSPMPGENSSKQVTDTGTKNDKAESSNNKSETTKTASPKSEDVEKSQFLISFELTAKNNSASSKSSPDKSENTTGASEVAQVKNQTSSAKGDETLKRKLQQLPHMNEMKKFKIEIEKTKFSNNTIVGTPLSSTFTTTAAEIPGKSKEHESSSKNVQLTVSKPGNISLVSKSSTVGQSTSVKNNSDISGTKRPVSGPQNVSPLKRKSPDMPLEPLSAPPKTISPLKLQVPKLDLKSHKQSDIQKPALKKIPDLKPSSALSQSPQNKGQTLNKIRMDLLANNSDPTIDRSKILSQVKSSLIPNTGQSSSGDPLKSLFDSCKINIPSSLSITLTDQKQDPRNPNESTNVEPKGVVNKNLASANSAPVYKVPSPPVHNYIEILKLPEGDQKKPNKDDLPSMSDIKTTTPNKGDPTSPQQKPKSSETPSAKGPIPNLKPIADTKLAKQSANFVGPKTFQQTFEQQLQSLQTDKKPKLLKNKSQVPKLVPATPKAFSAANLNNNPGNKPTQSSVSPNIETKPGAALDLSTPHNLQSQLNPQQTKAFETMQSIANLAKKQSFPSKSTLPASQSFSNLSNRPINPSGSGGPIRIPSTNAPQTNKKEIPGALPTNTLRQDSTNKVNHNKSIPLSSSPLLTTTYHTPSHHSPNTTQPSPRPQTRSPSSSPKLVIAEEKQMSNPNEQNANQSNQVTSTQLPSLNIPKSESPKASPGPSKPGLKPMKPLTSGGKITGIRQSMAPVVKPNPTPADIQLMAHQALLRHQIEMNAWLKAQRFDVYKSMSNISHQQQNDYNKDK